jgi:hypothetical protein
MIETLVDEEHVNHFLACKRVPTRRVAHLLPKKFFHYNERNQQIASCCRHPENHEIEAFFSCAAERDAGTPDIYILHCECGRKHRIFCVGGSEGPPRTGETAAEYAERLADAKRPFWETR